MNLRGKFTTEADGSFWFRSVKPGAYPVPIEGPAGVLLGAQRRHNWRPAHLHFIFFKPGWKTIASQVYTSDDKYLDTDSQFGVTRALVGHYVKHEREPRRPRVDGTWWSLEHTFVLGRARPATDAAHLEGRSRQRLTVWSASHRSARKKRSRCDGRGQRSRAPRRLRTKVEDSATRTARSR
jgi:catechol 1,2-dioxygenase